MDILGQTGIYRQLDLCKVYDTLNIFLEIRDTIFLYIHSRVSLHLRAWMIILILFLFFRQLQPFNIRVLKIIDLVDLFFIIKIYGADVIIREIEIASHRMKLFFGISAVCSSVPTLQFIAEHQHICQRMKLCLKWLISCTLIMSNAEFIQAVMHQNGCQGIQMGCCQFTAHFFKQLFKQYSSTEICMIHEMIKFIRMYRLIFQESMHLFLCKCIFFAQLISKNMGKYFISGRKFLTTRYLLKFFFNSIIQFNKGVKGIICYKRTVLTLISFYLKIRAHLLKRKFKWITDIMEQRGKSPVFQIMSGCLMLVFQPIVFLVCISVKFIGLINRQA